MVRLTVLKSYRIVKEIIFAPLFAPNGGSTKIPRGADGQLAGG